MEQEELEYDLTAEEVVAREDYFANHFPDGRKKAKTRPLVWVFIAFIMGLGALVYFWTPPLETFFDLAMILALLTAPVIATSLFLFLKPIRALRVSLFRARMRNPENALRIRVSIGPDSFTITTTVSTSKFQEVSTTTCRWEYAKRIAVEGSHAFLIVGPGKAFIFSERAFGDAESFQRFVEKAKKYHEASLRTVPGREKGT